MSHLEVAAALITLVSVALAIARRIWCWPAGALAVVLYFFVFFQAKLYADMTLQLGYFVMQLYGWRCWLVGTREQAGSLNITRATTKQLLALTCVGLLAALCIGTALGVWTNGRIPYWDALATSFSLIAVWMLAKRLLENWLLWIVLNLVYIGIFGSLRMYPSLMLYSVLLLLNVFAFRKWSRSVDRRVEGDEPEVQHQM